MGYRKYCNEESGPGQTRLLSPLFIFVNPNPTLRGDAAWALGGIGILDVKEELKKLETDNQRLFLYEEGELKEKTVAQLATEAIEET